jgi:Flp pilus assembly protein TadB
VTPLAAAAGVAVLLGLALAVSGLPRRPVTPREATAKPPRRRVDVPSPERLVLIAASALVVLVITRWPVAAAGVGLGVWYLSQPRRRVGDAAKADALTAWTEMLRDATGTPRGIEGVLTATADGAPALIRPHVLRMSRRLAYEPLDDALDDLADDLDHPLGDLVVTSLRLAARAGGRQIRAVLDDLADAAREEARMHRRIEVARERPRSDMRSVIVIMVVFVVLLMIVAQDYLDRYDTVVGQFVLLGVAATWAAGIATMVRMGRSQPVERFLARRLER